MMLRLYTVKIGWWVETFSWNSASKMNLQILRNVYMQEVLLNRSLSWM